MILCDCLSSSNYGIIFGLKINKKREQVKKNFFFRFKNRITRIRFSTFVSFFLHFWLFTKLKTFSGVFFRYTKVFSEYYTFSELSFTYIEHLWYNWRISESTMPLFGKSTKSPAELVKALKEAVNSLERGDKKAEKAQEDVSKNLVRTETLVYLSFNDLFVYLSTSSYHYFCWCGDNNNYVRKLTKCSESTFTRRVYIFIEKLTEI